MAKKRKYEDAATWQQRIDDWRRSGLSVTEFGRREGLANSTWLKWRKALGGQQGSATVGAGARDAQVSTVSVLAAPGGTASEPAKRQRSSGSAAVTFIELPASAESRGTIDYGVPFEVGLRSGRRLQVPAAFDADALERLITILEAR